MIYCLFYLLWHEDFRRGVTSHRQDMEGQIARGALCVVNEHIARSKWGAQNT